MTVDATDIIDDADEQTDRWREYVRPAAEWFHDHEGELFERDEAIESLEDELDVSTSVAQEAVSNLVADIVDPVVQVPLNGSRYVGIVEFFDFDGAYGYVHFDDNRGKEKRVVCAQCVHDAEHDSEVAHATAGDPHGTFEEGADYETLLDAVHDHYEIHDEVPKDVETGATLASGTTIGGNTAYHGGNIGTLNVTDFGPGTLNSGEFLTNSGGNLTGSNIVQYSDIVGYETFSVGASGTDRINRYFPDNRTPVLTHFEWDFTSIQKFGDASVGYIDTSGNRQQIASTSSGSEGWSWSSSDTLSGEPQAQGIYLQHNNNDSGNNSAVEIGYARVQYY